MQYEPSYILNSLRNIETISLRAFIMDNMIGKYIFDVISYQ